MISMEFFLKLHFECDFVGRIRDGSRSTAKNSFAVMNLFANGLTRQ